MSQNFDPATARSTPPVADRPGRACNGANPEIFYPEGRNYTDAAAVCRRCPHTADCLEWALTTRQGFGYLGGKTPTQRARILETRTAA